MSRAVYIPEPLLRRMVLAELSGAVDAWQGRFGLSSGGPSLRATAETCLVNAMDLANRDTPDDRSPYRDLQFPGARVRYPNSIRTAYDRCREAPRRNRNLGVFHRVWRAIQLLEAYAQRYPRGVDDYDDEAV